MYSREDVLFLLDEGDSVGAYEKRGVVRLSSHDAGMEALGSTLDRVQQGEVFHRECVCVCVCVATWTLAFLGLYLVQL